MKSFWSVEDDVDKSFIRELKMASLGPRFWVKHTDVSMLANGVIYFQVSNCLMFLKTQWKLGNCTNAEVDMFLTFLKIVLSKPWQQIHLFNTSSYLPFLIVEFYFQSAYCFIKIKPICVYKAQCRSFVRFLVPYANAIALLPHYAILFHAISTYIILKFISLFCLTIKF